MKKFLLFACSLLASSATLMAQTNQPTDSLVIVKKSDCDCECKDVTYYDCETKDFTSLKTDTVAGRISFFTNIGWQPMGYKENSGALNPKTYNPVYLTWDFIEGEGALARGFYWGGQFGLGIPFNATFREAQGNQGEFKLRESWYFGTHLTLDLFRANKFKVFVMGNVQAAFNNLSINRTELPTSTTTWVDFMRYRNSISNELRYTDLMNGMVSAQRDRVNMWNFTAQAQLSLGADILLRPSGFALRLQGGYQIPFEGVTSDWRMSYSDKNDQNSNKYTFHVRNLPFNQVQEGVFAKVSLTWLINKSKNCTKGTRRDCYKYVYIERGSSSPNGGGVNTYPTDTPRTPRTPSTPRTPDIPKTPDTPRPIPK